MEQLNSVITYPDYQKPLDFEIYDFKKWANWMTQYWSVSVYASIIYVTLVFGGIKWMENRKAFHLRGLLLLWNFSLTLFSLIAFIRLVPELWNELKNYGVTHSVCNRDLHTMTNSWWTLVFILFKIVEFGDTAFIVLRKQKLIFLHWYHHITVAMYCFFISGNFDPSSRWFGVINSFIHSVMYGYYFCKAMKISVPKNFAMTITTLQILQMVVGVAINILSYYTKASGNPCSRPFSNMYWSFLMYGSYLILFINFFRNSYQKKPKKIE